MVQGIDELRRRFGSLARQLQAELKPVLEAQAKKIVAQMNAVKPVPEIEIAWTWGAPPAGTVNLGRVSESKAGRDFISIYATAQTSEFPSGFPALARWFEFGTAPRFRKSGGYTGQITAQPYFYPVYRANTKNVRAAIARKARQVLKNA